MSRLNLAAGLAVGALLLVPQLAQAHYLLVAPTNWWNQDPNPNGGGAPQKTPPCGSPSEAPTLKATNVVNVYQAGQPVTVTVTPTVPHPGWWRISLREGAASTQTATAFPDPPEMGAPNSALQCTPPFIDNPVWSPMQPVIADKLGLVAGDCRAGHGHISKHNTNLSGDDSSGRPLQHGDPLRAAGSDDHDRSRFSELQLSSLCRHGARRQRDRYWRIDWHHRRRRARCERRLGGQDRGGRRAGNRYGRCSVDWRWWQHNDWRRRHDRWRCEWLVGWRRRRDGRGSGQRHR